MTSLTRRGVIVSDFNASSLASCLKSHEDGPAVETVMAPFGQVMPALLNADLPCWHGNPEFAVVWTQPQSVIESFGDALRYQPVSVERILTDVDAYASLLVGLRERVNFVLVPTWVAPSFHRDFGLLDMKTGLGMTNTLMRMNLRLVDNLEKWSHTYVLDSQRWLEAAGVHAYSPKLWYMGKIPFGNDVFIEATKDIKATLSGLYGESKKLVLLDLDDTLWGGIVGEVGWSRLTLGGHDPAGEAYADFQRALKALTCRGVLLGIVSKNEEAVALEAIRRHPEMVLRIEDFAGWRINWQDKAANILDLVKSLNLGLQSVVFLDDSPVERARVREALPEVLVPEWPDDKRLYARAVRSLRCFNPPSITQEDMHRSRMYQSERHREESKRDMVSMEEWLKTLGITVKVEVLGESNLQRVAQLLNRTNQMNLTTRRMPEAELFRWAQAPHRRLWAFRVSDRFGDSGITGILSLEIQDLTGTIVDFVLSCRVMGRKIEEAMLYRAVHYARSKGLTDVRARFFPTEMNKPCLDFWLRSGFIYRATDNEFWWDVKNHYPNSESIMLDGDWA